MDNCTEDNSCYKFCVKLPEKMPGSCLSRCQKTYGLEGKLCYEMKAVLTGGVSNLISKPVEVIIKMKPPIERPLVFQTPDFLVRGGLFFR